MTRTVAITGAGSGIGRSIARAFADNGDRVFACDISQSRLNETLGELGANAEGAIVDVSDYEALQEFLKDAAASDGLSVLVNNAAVFDGYAGVAETTVELWGRVLEINLSGYFFGCKIAAELMMAQGSGRIVNIGSVASFRGSADGIAYTASKAGILGLTRRLAIDLAQHGVTANVICPGAITTDIRRNSEEILAGIATTEMDRGVTATMSQEILDWVIPMHRKGTPEEVAALALFLASKEAAYITGASLAVDGGWLAV
jgi:NAD(P)-dependent dehydrogenase (short-subunit alcohol dehydrogenase family)